MKSLKFKPHLIEDILFGKKTKTWRLFDDKDLSFGDHVEFINADDKTIFANAKLTLVDVKPLSGVTKNDLTDAGWEESKTTEELMEHYKKLYNRDVTSNTAVKIISFEITK